MNYSTDLPIRLTICETAQQASALIQELLDAGFSKDRISVLCSHETHAKQFAEYVDETPGEEKRDSALNASAWAALGLGAFAAVAGLVTTGGTAIMAIGALYGVALTGTLAAVFAARGTEKELADYYDQAISLGKILVAIDVEDPQRQRVADEILKKSGNRTAALPRESHTET